MNASSSPQHLSKLAASLSQPSDPENIAPIDTEKVVQAMEPMASSPQRLIVNFEISSVRPLSSNTVPDMTSCTIRTKGMTVMDSFSFFTMHETSMAMRSEAKMISRNETYISKMRGPMTPDFGRWPELRMRCK